MKMKTTFFIIFLTASLLTTITSESVAQIQEPDIVDVERAMTELNNQYNGGLTFDFVINNFGFGVGGEYRRVLASQTEGVVNLRITGLRDVREQTFTDAFFGQQIVPNKNRRAYAFPFMLGIRQRLFADMVQDQYRFFVSFQGGPVASFSIPYFNDRNNNGYRETGFEVPTPDSQRRTPERINDVFSGWSEGEWHFGGTGELKVGIDFGRNYARVTSLEFGYYFNYFPDGIQMMMPNQPDLRDEQPGPDQTRFQFDDDGELIVEPFFDKQRFFGTPQITLKFGRLW